ncbi:hypothetical protein ADK86_24305 [Streptomyces sp. NRRL F-5755]|uniref:amino acid adenylation domain-containing protein n=1 Tax=Streptomyces sp. NRRL F-5755 TaxID=1519475 RepID=UPI0006AD9604|nr:amino acid adenylation domain-containing protein [Streptomyces sp. NRRL F-5755]KOT91083.1 hypothetical protein ADK86_24305 [Streptomyces sp. NRRL F-5755]
MSRTLHDLVTRTARRHPGATALAVAGEAPLTYAQLIEQSTTTARAIAARIGTVPRRIGLMGHKNTATYVSYLAILQLGASVVPISTTAPAARVAAICEAAQLPLVLTDQADVSVLTGLDEIPGAPEVVPIAELNTTRACATPPPAPDGTNPVAYIIFTSGTTGRPKGVPITHTNALTCVEHNIRTYEVAPGDRVTQTFDFAFDPSVFDIFVAWGAGATLVAPAPADLLHPAAWVRREQITHWFSVPSTIAAAATLGELEADTMPSLKISMFAGEQLTVDRAKAWKAAAAHSRMENLYGPTELTIVVSRYCLPADTRQWPETDNGTVPIGRIYPHMEWAVVMDGHAALQGELCVRGPQRFTGYLDPQHNTGRYYDRRGDVYLPLAEGTAPTADAWYRTGDRVAVTNDGGLLHLGRLDSQVKIRGFRIELPEVEGALRLLPYVQDAVVVAAPGRSGHLELSAFYTGTATDARTLRSGLGATLPAYMIPRRLTHLDSFPLTPNGKVDRTHLLQQA